MAAVEHVVDSNKSLCRRRTDQAPETFVNPRSQKAIEIPLKVRRGEPRVRPGLLDYRSPMRGADKESPDAK